MRRKKHRRSKIELYVDIMRAIDMGRCSPSRIVCSANLSYDRVIRYLRFLEEKNLVQKIKGKKSYDLTEGGVEVIQYFSRIENAFYKDRAVLRQTLFTKSVPRSTNNT